MQEGFGGLPDDMILLIQERFLISAWQWGGTHHARARSTVLNVNHDWQRVATTKTLNPIFQVRRLGASGTRLTCTQYGRSVDFEEYVLEVAQSMSTGPTEGTIYGPSEGTIYGPSEGPVCGPSEGPVCGPSEGPVCGGGFKLYLWPCLVFAARFQRDSWALRTNHMLAYSPRRHYPLEIKLHDSQ
jgi:hypothetical protein